VARLKKSNATYIGDEVKLKNAWADLFTAKFHNIAISPVTIES